MDEDKLKEIWDLIDGDTDYLEGYPLGKENFLGKRKKSLERKIRGIFNADLVIKGIGYVFIFVDLFLYANNPVVINLCLFILIFQTIAFIVQFDSLSQFKKASSPSRSVRDNLSGMLALLKRKSLLYQFNVASNQVAIFIPGLLIYFFIVYGRVKPITTMSFFVFSILLLIYITVQFIRTKSALKYYIKHITVCLTDLNEKSLAFVAEKIERKRKNDERNIVFTALAIVFGFIVFLALLKAIVT